MNIKLINTSTIEVEGVAYQVPNCFSFHDERDPSCRRCQVRGYCIEYQEATLPGCFGLLQDESAPECQVCILQSQCAQAQIKHIGANQMPGKIIIRKPIGTVAAAVPVAVPVAEVEPEVVETKMSYPDMEVEALRAELLKRGLPTDGRKTLLVQRLMRDDAGEPVSEVAAVEVEPVAVDASIVMDIVAALQAGQVLQLASTDDGKFILSLGFNGMPVAATKTIDVSDNGAKAVEVTPAPAGKGLRGDAFWQEVYTPEFYAFLYKDSGSGKSWETMTKDEKYAFAEKKLKVEWAKNADPKLDSMAMAQAVQVALGLTKYKPEYAKAAARDALRGK